MWFLFFINYIFINFFFLPRILFLSQEMTVYLNYLSNSEGSIWILRRKSLSKTGREMTMSNTYFLCLVVNRYIVAVERLLLLLSLFFRVYSQIMRLGFAETKEHYSLFLRLCGLRKVGVWEIMVWGVNKMSFFAFVLKKRRFIWRFKIVHFINVNSSTLKCLKKNKIKIL